jgi:cardiolipin synthase
VTPDDSRWLTIPNALSISRVALIPVWWWLMKSGHTYWGAALIVYAIISDVADGWIARRWNQNSKWGRVLDPIGDKLAAFVVGLFCVMHRDLPLLAFLLTIARDVALLIGGLIIMRTRHVAPPSVDMGRYAALLWGLVLLLYAFNWQPYAGYVVWPVAVFYVVAGFAYVRRLTTQ